MPRYFFHIYDDKGCIPDDEGMELADDAAAKAEGIISAHEMRAHDLRYQAEDCVRHITVMDGVGNILAIYSFSRIMI